MIENSRIPRPPEDWLPGQLLLGDYEVQRVLGQGGMGKVYLVRSRTTATEFALKRALIKDDKNRQNFLSELQTWIDLPEHPHIAGCRFFRTIDDEIAIFSEYVGGGTLADWIRERRLLTLEQILDVAIQSAWGLQALHDHGLVHQDMKPGNVLMTPEGIAKVTDFGLARARARGSEGQFLSPSPAQEGQNVLVSFGGMTPAYCSPEQAAKQTLSRKTDIWSWGVSVLDMFYGEASCRYGQAAGEALEGYFEPGAVDATLPRLPEGMTKILGKCFQPKPEHRWESMGEVADALLSLYSNECEHAYPRQIPEMPPAIRDAAQDLNASYPAGWPNPHNWLVRALKADGRDPSEAEQWTRPHKDGGARRAMAVADLAIFEEARAIFERLVRAGRKDLELHLGLLCMEQAKVHRFTEDVPGEIRFYDQATEILERLVNQEHRRELSDALASLYMNKATTVSNMGENRAAIDLYDRAIEIRERLVHKEGRSEFADGLAMLYSSKANTLTALADYGVAGALYVHAIEILERLVHQEGCREKANDLASVYVNKAILVGHSGNHRAEMALYDQAIEIRERLVNEEGRHELTDALATLYLNKARVVGDWGDHRVAGALYDRAIEILEQLVNKEGRREQANNLATAYLNKGKWVTYFGDKSGRIMLCDRAIEILDRMLCQEGRSELFPALAKACENKGDAVAVLGDHRTALKMYDRAIEIYERLVNQENRRELAGDLAFVRSTRGGVLICTGRGDEGRAEVRKAAAVLKTEVARGRVDLADVSKMTEDFLSKLEGNQR